ncbi:hypothetical protein GCM10007391_21000 [Alteromonas halophila]|uniref:Uncharacterized protein n=1 Tax=Alteromonas halophila TaxID=516698 RepID=A0A918JNW5_9ALTE|nr:hypothetical protein GCM10007391_21000 [Alteromonas halophila]
MLFCAPSARLAASDITRVVKYANTCITLGRSKDAIFVFCLIVIMIQIVIQPYAMTFARNVY